MSTNGLMVAVSTSNSYAASVSGGSDNGVKKESEFSFASMFASSFTKLQSTSKSSDNLTVKQLSVKQVKVQVTDRSQTAQNVQQRAQSSEVEDGKGLYTTGKTEQEATDAAESTALTKSTDAGQTETKEVDDVLSEENIEKLAGLLNDIVNAVSGMLDITPENLTQFLEDNGINLAELPEGTTLRIVVFHFMGNVNEVDLLSNEDLLNRMDLIFAKVEDLLNEFTKQNPELKEVRELLELTDLRKSLEDMGLKLQSTEDAPENLSTAEGVDRKPGEKLEADETYGKRFTAKSTEVKHEEKTVEVKITETSGNAKEESLRQNGKDTGKGLAENMFSQFADKLVNAAQQNAEITGDFDNVKLMREIVNQLTEQIKVSISPAHTSLEMTLNPENLGKIALNISSKDGVMTATLHTSNEAAKEAIESQLITLKETIESQGIKVEAIEVTVSSFAFSQSKDAETGKENAGASSGKKRSYRVSETDDVEATSGTEAPEIMQGSTVDFVA